MNIIVLNIHFSGWIWWRSLKVWGVCDTAQNWRCKPEGEQFSVKFLLSNIVKIKIVTQHQRLFMNYKWFHYSYLLLNLGIELLWRWKSFCRVVVLVFSRSLLKAPCRRSSIKLGSICIHSFILFKMQNWRTLRHMYSRYWIAKLFLVFLHSCIYE